jgi:hypothetical protein
MEHIERLQSALDSANPDVSGKAVESSHWGAFEVKMTEESKRILEMLKELGFSGKATSCGSNEHLTTLGMGYHSLRADSKICARIGLPVLTVDIASLSGAKPKSKGGSRKHPPKGVSADEIRHRKMMKDYDSQRAHFLASWKSSSWDEIPTCRSTTTIDALVLDFLQHIDGFCKNISRIEKSRSHDLIFGGAKFLETLKKLEVRNVETNKLEYVNQLLISDLDAKLSEFKKLSKFSIVDAAAENPKFLVKTSYDGIVPNTICVPYESQVKLIELLHRNKTNGFLACLNSLTGEGKTTLIVAVASLVQAWNRENSTRYEVLFCCSGKLETIKKQVGQNAWNSLIGFALASIKRRAGFPDTVKLQENYNCKKSLEGRVLTIADIASAILLLTSQVEDKKRLVVEQGKLSKLNSSIVNLDKQIQSAIRGEHVVSSVVLGEMKKNLAELREKHVKMSKKVGKIASNANKQYILFFDEPTVDLDIQNSPMVPYLSSIFKCMPKFTIFSTATAPEREDIMWLEHIFLGKYPDAEIEFIKSSKVRIGSEISDLNGNVFIPHADCVTLEQYLHVISVIEKDYFLQKCYTTNVVNHLFAKLTALSKVHKVPIPSYLNIEKYLNLSENMNQDSICKLAIEYLKFVLKIVSSIGAELADDVVKNFCSSKFTKRGVNFTTLATGANQFESQTLIVTENPLDFTEKYFADYISVATQMICKANGFDDKVSFDSIIRALDTMKTRYNSAKRSIEEDKSKVRGVDGAEHEAQRRIRIEALGPVPRLMVPDKFVIGSASYMRDRGVVSTLNTFNPEVVNWAHLDCPDLLKYALCIGIGLYSRENSPSYTRVVLEMATKGQLAYLIADDVICYGTNYPIENVIVDNTCLRPDSHSVKTVFQVFARAGRPGKSWRANIFADTSVLSMINEYIHFPNRTDIEIKNMNKALHHCVLDSVISKKLTDIQRMKDEYVLVMEAEARVERERLETEARLARERLETEARVARELEEAEEAEEAKELARITVRKSMVPKATKYVPPQLRR